MTITSALSYSVTPGRREEFTSVLSDAKKLHEANGGHIRASQIIFGGEAAGNISYANAFESLGAMAAFSDAMNQREGPGPIMAALSADNPPATLVSAVVREDVTPKPPSTLLSSRSLLSVIVLSPTPGRRDEVMEIIARGQEQVESFGGELRVSRSRWSGTNTGTIGYAVFHDSLAALAEFDAKVQELEERPLAKAMQSGAATVVNSLLARAIDL